MTALLIYFAAFSTEILRHKPQLRIMISLQESQTQFHKGGFSCVDVERRKREAEHTGIDLVGRTIVARCMSSANCITPT